MYYYSGNNALITVSTQKLFSGGLDLNLLMGESHPVQKAYFVLEIVRLFARITSLGIPTLALVNNSAVAARTMIAFSHDEIYVHQKATFYCNEIENGLLVPPGLSAIINRKLQPKDFRDMILFAKRFSAEDGVKAGFVDTIFK